jgi:hypothetical protein
VASDELMLCEKHALRAWLMQQSQVVLHCDS